MNSLERAHLSCVMAQRLNNKAAEEIESGDYDRAIKTLHQALRLSRVDFRQPQMAHILMLEACIAHSGSSSRTETVEKVEDNSSSALVVYEQSLRVPPRYMSHPMGRVLPLLIMYNMALTNQLQSIKETSMAEKRSLLNRALKLYELAYHQWQNNNNKEHQHEQEQNNSLRFNMILVNNIGDIHRSVNNRQKFQRCMQQLSRNMMHVRPTDKNNTMMIYMETLFRRNIEMSGGRAA